MNVRAEEKGVAIGDADATHMASLHLSTGGPTQAELNWLQAQGVSRKALANSWPIGACTAQIDGRYFEPAATGERAITILITDGDVPVDIATWAPHSGKLASYLGTAFAMGQDAVFSSATYFAGGALHVHENPLDWLKDGRRGIVILRPELCYAYLGGRGRLSFDCPEYAQRVKRWLVPPYPRTQLFVRKCEVVAA